MRSDRKEQKQVITIVGGFLLWPKALEADYEKKKKKKQGQSDLVTYAEFRYPVKSECSIAFQFKKQ